MNAIIKYLVNYPEMFLTDIKDLIALVQAGFCQLLLCSAGVFVFFISHIMPPWVVYYFMRKKTTRIRRFICAKMVEIGDVIMTKMFAKKPKRHFPIPPPPLSPGSYKSGILKTDAPSPNWTPPRYERDPLNNETE